MKNVSSQLLDDVCFTVSNTCPEVYREFEELILKSNPIFIAGTGRSGLVGKFFGMRLMHLGKTVYIVGETSTPAIGEGDLLIAISGSGNTPTIKNAVNVAKTNGSYIALITESQEADLRNFSDRVVYLEKRVTAENSKIAPMGTLFELSSLMFLESCIGQLIVRNSICEAEMKKRHANLE